MHASLETENLTLVPQSVEDVRAMISAMRAEERRQFSADWLARLDAATVDDVWTYGFSLVHRQSGQVIGQGGFKGPPSADGMVEIAYAVNPNQQGKGYATEAAKAMTAFAFRHAEVQLVRAHTLPQPNASTRVLTKCGFQHLGEVIDPEDGPVWRWEKRRLQ